MFAYVGTWNGLTSFAHIVSPRTRMVSPRSRSIKLTNRELPSFKKKLTLSLVNRIGKVHAQNERD